MKKIISLLGLLICLCISIQPASAENEGRVDFSVKADLPASQIDANKTYFSLDVEPGEKQRLAVNVFNHGFTERTFKGSITYATTNRNGLIEYSETRPDKKDASLITSLPEVAKLEKEKLTIPAGEQAVFYIDVTIPNEMTGTLLGGIRVEEVVPEQEKEQGGIQIQNAYAYVVGIELKHQAEQIRPNLELREIKPELINYRTAVQVDLQNPEAVLMDDLQIHAKIYRKDEATVYRVANLSGARLAPNSTLAFPVDWRNEQIKPGEYRLVMTASGEQGSWRWDEPFVIGDEVRTINENAIIDEPPYLRYIGIFGSLMLVLIIVYIVWRKRRKERDHNESHR